MDIIIRFIKPTKNKILFILSWLVYIITILFQGYRLTPQDIYILIFYYIMGCIFNLLYDNKCIIKNFPSQIYLLLLLISVDQLVKLYIKISLPLNTKFPIIKNWLYIKVVHNTHNSGLLGHFKIDFVPLWVVLIFKVLLFVFAIICYLHFSKKHQDDLFVKFWAPYSFVFFFSGLLCSILDTAIWGYSLDFINIHNVMTVDFKDIFISIGEACFLIILIRHLILQDLRQKKLQQEYIRKP